MTDRLSAQPVTVRTSVNVLPVHVRHSYTDAHLTPSTTLHQRQTSTRSYFNPQSTRYINPYVPFIIIDPVLYIVVIHLLKG